MRVVTTGSVEQCVGKVSVSVIVGEWVWLINCVVQTLNVNVSCIALGEPTEETDSHGT